MSCQYGDKLCKIILKSDFKKQSYEPDSILLKGHAVTLTFKIATQMLRAIRRLVVKSVKRFPHPTSNNEVMVRTRIGRMD